MPKSWIGSRYTGYSCTSSRFRNVASEVTGPGVTTWRLVRIRPRSASTTKPVACAEEFHSVSKARVWSISMATTLSATRASVPRQAALSPSLCGIAACAAEDCAADLLCRLRLRALRHRRSKNGGSGQHQSEQQNAA